MTIKHVSFDELKEYKPQLHGGSSLSFKLKENTDPFKILFGEDTEESVWNTKQPYYLSNDPVENYMTIKNSDVHQEVKLNHVKPGNRSVVIVYGCKNSPEDFRERAAKLISSLNTQDTMKAVVVTVSDGKAYAGLTFKGEKPGGVSEKDLEMIKSKFTQVIEVKNGKS